MEVLLYLPEKKGAGARLLKIAKVILAGQEIKLCQSIKDLSRCLHQQIAHFRIAVLYLETRRDLLDVQSLSDCLGDMKLILVLPDGDPLTVSQAHTLRPRFITYKDYSFDDLGMVLKQMVNLYQDTMGDEEPKHLKLMMKRKRSVHSGL